MYSGSPCIPCGFNVAVFIPDNDAATHVDIHCERSIANQLRLRFTALACIVRSVRTIEPHRKGTEQFIDTRINGANLIFINKSAGDAALVGNDRERQTLRAQTVERFACVGQRFDQLWIAVVRYVDDQRAVAIEDYGAGLESHVILILSESE